jgi:hypothetical protein
MFCPVCSVGRRPAFGREDAQGRLWMIERLVIESEIHAFFMADSVAF